MDMIGRIRHLHSRGKKSEREIARLTGLSRNTISKWLREPIESAPKYRRSEGTTTLAPFHETLKLSLKVDLRRPAHGRRTAKALFAEIKTASYGGCYSRVTDFIREWRASEGLSASKDAFVPLKFALGEAFQFDWSEERLVVGGIYYRMQVSHMKLCASRAFWLVACVSDLLTLDTFVCLVRAEHPLTNVELTAKTFSELRFVHARLGGATGHQMVERWLDTHGVERTVALRLAHFTIAPEIVRQTDLAVIFPRNMAERVNHAGAFRLLTLPFETLSVEVKVHTHSHFASDLGIRWLRDTLIKQWSTVANAIEVPSNKTARSNVRGARSP